MRRYALYRVHVLVYLCYFRRVLGSCRRSRPRTQDYQSLAWRLYRQPQARLVSPSQWKYTLSIEMYISSTIIPGWCEMLIWIHCVRNKQCPHVFCQLGMACSRGTFGLWATLLFKTLTPSRWRSCCRGPVFWIQVADGTVEGLISPSLVSALRWTQRHR